MPAASPLSRRTLLALLLVSPSAAAAAPADPAVTAYLRETEAEQRAASDRRVTSNAASLFRDPGSPVLGDAEGDVTLVQFYDYNCPFTRGVEPRVQALLRADPRVRLILKPFTIEQFASSVVAARAAIAASKQGRLQPFHQSMLAVNAGRALTTAAIFDQAERAGLDMPRLRREMDEPAAYEQLIKNFNLARALRIFQTPTFIIDGHIITEPSAGLDFPALVAAARARNSQPT